MKNQSQWIELVKTDGCQSCHQLGDKATRELPASLGHFDSSAPAWSRAFIGTSRREYEFIAAKVRPGAGAFDVWRLDRPGCGRRISEGSAARPQGIERNVVITEWDWGIPTEYFHDEIATDRRNPTLNANGSIYGVHEVSTDTISVLDPVHNSASELPVLSAIPIRPLRRPGYVGPFALLGK